VTSGGGCCGFMVSVYSPAWFLLNARVNLLAYRIFDPPKAKTLPFAEPR